MYVKQIYGQMKEDLAGLKNFLSFFQLVFKTKLKPVG